MTGHQRTRQQSTYRRTLVNDCKHKRTKPVQVCGLDGNPIRCLLCLDCGVNLPTNPIIAREH